MIKVFVFYLNIFICTSYSLNNQIIDKYLELTQKDSLSVKDLMLEFEAANFDDISNSTNEIVDNCKYDDDNFPILAFYFLREIINNNIDIYGFINNNYKNTVRSTSFFIILTFIYNRISIVPKESQDEMGIRIDSVEKVPLGIIDLVINNLSNQSIIKKGFLSPEEDKSLREFCLVLISDFVKLDYQLEELIWNYSGEEKISQNERILQWWKKNRQILEYDYHEKKWIITDE